ncbi:RxLR effector protein [Phytophthora megakarya]|uniref:RxLR effector protein n=1 Tax=Phytophthora megakarya TaxID=4795 RepID=A0A225WCF6_9STRA|nr:RxLR effector protein [Phytophthora megakarya]
MLNYVENTIHWLRHGIYLTLVYMDSRGQQMPMWKTNTFSTHSRYNLHGSSKVTKAKSSDWINAALNQTPTELWAHKNELSEYQVWIAYQGATCQLNLYHEDQATDNSCRRTQQCQGVKETIEHILWECQISQVCWQHLISYWTGEEQTNESMAQYMVFCAKWQALPISRTRKETLHLYEQNQSEKMEDTWKRIWRISSTIYNEIVNPAQLDYI